MPVTVHEQPAGAVTLSETLPPAASIVGLLVEESVEPAQETAADWDTTWVTPAMRIDALRAAPLLAATA